MKIYNQKGELVSSSELFDIVNILNSLASILNNHIAVDSTGSVRSSITLMPAVPWSGSPNVAFPGSGNLINTVATLTNLSKMDGMEIRLSLLQDAAGSSWGTCIRNFI